MTVSATQDARQAVTAASAAVPPSRRISIPAAAVAGCPAAIPLIMRDCYPIRRPSPGCRAANASRHAGGGSGVERDRRHMALTKEAKLEAVKQYGRAETDTGSTQ